MPEISDYIFDPNLERIVGQAFDKKELATALSLIGQKEVKLSFSRGDISSYLIVAGLVKCHGIFEGKISCRLENGQHTFRGQCSCSGQNKEGHCFHIILLLLKFFLQHQTTKRPLERGPYSSNNLKGVRAKEYGTIISGPKELQGNIYGSTSTFFSHQYLLEDNTIISFPLPKKFQGQIQIKLYPYSPSVPSDSFSEDKRDFYTQNLFIARFSYLGPKGEAMEKISFFETLYLFDWVGGNSYSLPQEVANFLGIVIKRGPMPINDYLRATQKLRKGQTVCLFVQATSLDEHGAAQVQPQISLGSSHKSNLLDITLRMVAPNGQFVPLFDEFSLFSFKGGALNTFKKRSRAYDFIKNVPKLLQFRSTKISKYLRFSSEQNSMENLMEALCSQERAEAYDQWARQLYFCKMHIIKHLLSTLIDFFGPHLFRSGHFDPEEKKLSLKISKSLFLEKVASFHEEIMQHNIAIFYNHSKIGTWSPEIKFTRRPSQINWFETNLEITPRDLEIIADAKLGDDQVLTQKGIVLLSQSQKNMLKFLKSYTSSNKEQMQAIEKEGKDYYRFQLPFRRSRIFELFELKKLGLDGALSEEEILFCQKLQNLKEIPISKIPKKLQGHLRPYQATGHYWLHFLWKNRLGACLADDMGLGKTVQAISFLQAIISDIEKVIIICPVSILFNWCDEFAKFSDLSHELCLYYGENRKLDLQKKIIITSYGIMKKEAMKTFQEITFDVIIFDEAQSLKNISSLGAQSARKMKGKFHLCLTGTPVENDISEFYNIIDLSVPGIWGPRPMGKSQALKQSPSLAKKIARPFILRRSKRQVLKELPEKVENTVHLNFSKAEKAYYLSHLEVIKNRFKQHSFEKRRGEIFKGILELRLLCLWQSQETIHSSKVIFLLKSLEQILADGHQALIFSQFTSYLNVIQKFIEEKGISFSRIDGQYSIKKRAKNIETFQAGESKVFLISLKAGGLGLNLTAASYVYIMDPWWNPASEAQAVDRAHRIGQKKAINVYRLIIKDSIEEKVVKLQDAKRQLFNELLGNEGEEYFTGKLTMKDFQALLSL